MKILGIFLSLAVFFFNVVKAQDPVFVQFYSSPLYLNPAFAGSAGGSRAGLTYRDQWPAISGTFVTFSASYDQYVNELHGGLGILFLNDRAGEGTINTTSASIIYSYQLIVNRNFSIKMGFQAGYIRKEVDWSKLAFGSQIPERYSFIYETNGERPTEVRGNFDLSTGILVNSENLFGGVALHHLTQPKEGFIEQDLGRIPMKITLHVGYNYQKEKNSKFAISPNILYQKQQDFRQINLGLYARYAPVVFGIWYKQANKNSYAFIAMLSVEYKNFRIGYSYDITLSTFSSAIVGSHEFTLGYLFNFKNKEDKIIPLKTIAF